MILCINGSPKPDSNLRRMLESIGSPVTSQRTPAQVATRPLRRGRCAADRAGLAS